MATQTRYNYIFESVVDIIEILAENLDNMK